MTYDLNSFQLKIERAKNTKGWAVAVSVFSIIMMMLGIGLFFQRSTKNIGLYFIIFVPFVLFISQTTVTFQLRRISFLTNQLKKGEYVDMSSGRILLAVVLSLILSLILILLIGFGLCLGVVSLGGGSRF